MPGYALPLPDDDPRPRQRIHAGPVEPVRRPPCMLDDPSALESFLLDAFPATDHRPTTDQESTDDADR